MYTLSRTIDENLTFYLYSEWTGMKAVGEHFNSTYLKEYLKTIAELNVVRINAFIPSLVKSCPTLSCRDYSTE